MNQLNMSKNTPEKKFRASPVVATIWTNEAKNKDGETRLYRTVSLERIYKDKEGEWKSTSSFRVHDLPKASLVINKAYEYITIKEEGDGIEEM